MKSKSKTIASNETLHDLFKKALKMDVKEITSLGDGEFNAVYSGDGIYCIKMAPLNTIPVLTYEKNMIQSETYWYNQIEKYTDISVPKRLYISTDPNEKPSPWFLMEQVPGVSLEHFKFQNDEEKNWAHLEQIAMVSKIHQIQSEKFGYIQNQLYDNWYDALYSMVINVLDDAKKVGHPSKRGEKLLEFIKHYEILLKDVSATMVNFDLWPSNIMCHQANGKIHLAWIDPERSFYGDPLADFVCFEFLVPLDKKTKTLAMYNQVAEKKISAGQNEQIRYSFMVAYLGLIMEVEKYYRYTRSNPGWARNVLVSKLLYRRAFSVLNKYR
ncbi:MAG: phosphotransferase family protein [Candidatus Izemoplasmatales bacterium]